MTLIAKGRFAFNYLEGTYISINASSSSRLEKNFSYVTQEFLSHLFSILLPLMPVIMFRNINISLFQFVLHYVRPAIQVLHWW